MAARTRRTPDSPGDLITHIDAGSRYTLGRHTEHLTLEGIEPSIGIDFDMYYNAPMEIMNGLF